MRVVVILAHPNPASFNHAIADRVVSTLREVGHHVILHDLYAEGFSAVMSAAERVAYDTDTPVLDPLVGAHDHDIQDAEALVFVYPTWWSSMPAILKGWFERVMVPGVGFVFNHRQKVRPGLTNIRRMVGISTYGSPWSYVKLINDNGRRTIQRSLRLSTGWGTRTCWLAMYRLDGATPEQRDAFLAKVERKMRAL